MKNHYHLYRNAWRFDGAPHEEQKLEKKEWHSLLKQGGLMVRNTYNFDCQQETAFWSIIKDKYGGLEELTSKTRNRIFKAFDNLEFKLIDISIVKEFGYPILKATYEDYAVSDREMNKEIFDSYLQVYNYKKHECWGIYDKVDGQLIGFQVNWLWDDACQYDLIGILPKYKRNQTFPYYGLFYSMNQYYLQEKGLKYVTDGSRSVSEHSNIQPFMIEKFNFRKAYCKLEVHYRWWMKTAVNLLYPFRNIITIPSVKAILNMEAMQRGKK